MAALKRRFSRLSLAFPAEITIGDLDPFQVPKLVNLAVGGCLLPTHEEVEVGTDVAITIPLAEHISIEKIQVSGKVVRYEDGFVAVQFETITPGSLKHLHNLIRYNSTDPEQIDEEIKDHPGLF